MTDFTPTDQDREDFLAGYAEAQLWANTYADGEIDPESGYPELVSAADADSVPAITDIAPDTRADAEADCGAFLKGAAEILGTDDDGNIRWAYTGDRAAQWSGAELAGHDFALTRNGHGAGFWDRGLGEVGERLSDLARLYGESSWYVGDDGSVTSL